MQQQLAEAPDIRDAVELTLQPRVEQPIAIRAEALPARVVTPADLIQIAMESGDKDIDRLERLMKMDLEYRALQEQDRKRDVEIAFEADFVGFTGENISIPKAKLVDRAKGGKFMQAEFDDVCSRLKPGLSKHGFGFRHKETFGARTVVTPDGDVNVPWVWVVCILSHRRGHKDILELDGPADTQTANTPLQNAQSAGSYMKRQSLLAITGTATGGEDDENNMRKPAGGDASDATVDAGPDPLDALRDAGRAESMNGMAALTAWWAKLSARQQKDMSGDFSGMRKAARVADDGGAK